MVKKCSTLGMCKDPVHTNQFYNSLWVQQENMESTKKWSCEDVAKWVTSNEGFPDDVDTALLWNKVNRSALLIMEREDLK